MLVASIMNRRFALRLLGFLPKFARRCSRQAETKMRTRSHRVYRFCFLALTRLEQIQQHAAAATAASREKNLSMMGETAYMQMGMGQPIMGAPGFPPPSVGEGVGGGRGGSMHANDMTTHSMQMRAATVAGHGMMSDPSAMSMATNPGGMQPIGMIGAGIEGGAHGFDHGFAVPPPGIMWSGPGGLAGSVGAYANYDPMRLMMLAQAQQHRQPQMVPGAHDMQQALWAEEFARNTALAAYGGGGNHVVGATPSAGFHVANNGGGGQRGQLSVLGRDGVGGGNSDSAAGLLIPKLEQPERGH
jgi:hypothetical protein